MEKIITFIRHGETEWSLSGKHTGKTDIPLTEKGMKQALDLSPVLQKASFAKAFISPSTRAKETFKKVNLNAPYEIDADFQEWDYGDYEGLSSIEIHKKNPSWTIFTHGAPGGESLEDIDKRTSKILKKLDSTEGDIIIFSSGHILRALATKLLATPLSFGNQLCLITGSISILQNNNSVHSILTWNSIPNLAISDI